MAQKAAASCAVSFSVEKKGDRCVWHHSGPSTRNRVSRGPLGMGEHSEVPCILSGDHDNAMRQMFAADFIRIPH